MTEWKIQPRAHACQACGKGFADKQPYYTLLFDKRHGLDRLDVCPACWDSQYSQGANDRKGFVSFWQGVFMVPPPPPPEPIQKESAESLLRKLMELNVPKYMTACFILAVMLERKRMLKVKAQSVEDGQRVLVYEHAKSGDLFTIVDPGLQLDQLDAVQQQVADLLEHGLSAGQEAPSAADGSADRAPTDQDQPLETAGRDPNDNEQDHDEPVTTEESNGLGEPSKGASEDGESDAEEPDEDDEDEFDDDEDDEDLSDKDRSDTDRSEDDEPEKNGVKAPCKGKLPVSPSDEAMKMESPAST